MTLRWPLRLRSLRPLVYRAPSEAPVVTSFGTMRDRPMLLVRAEDHDGTVGWGEVWCNFPSVGAEHRARLIDSVLAGLLVDRAFESPADAFTFLSDRTAVLALQAGEPGPFAQCIAGIDVALWDLVARRATLPLWRLLGGTQSEIGVYASGLNPDQPERLAAASLAAGHRAFKLKVGFGMERDCGNLRALRKALGEDSALMADANQGWDVAQAQAAAPLLAPFRLGWLEEPLRADRPWPEWQALAETGIPLAAGENLPGEAALAAAIGSGALRVVQPDIGKWGGFTGNAPLARRILAAGLSFCPHWLAGGVGLLASAHLLAAIGGPGMLEIDANPNPLRTLTCGALDTIVEGCATLPDTPGFGVEPDEMTLEPYRVRH